MNKMQSRLTVLEERQASHKESIAALRCFWRGPEDDAAVAAAEAQAEAENKLLIVRRFVSPQSPDNGVLP